MFHILLRCQPCGSISTSYFANRLTVIRRDIGERIIAIQLWVESRHRPVFKKLFVAQLWCKSEFLKYVLIILEGILIQMLRRLKD